MTTRELLFSPDELPAISWFFRAKSDSGMTHEERLNQLSTRYLSEIHQALSFKRKTASNKNEKITYLTLCESNPSCIEIAVENILNIMTYDYSVELKSNPTIVNDYRHVLDYISLIRRNHHKDDGYDEHIGSMCYWSPNSKLSGFWQEGKSTLERYKILYLYGRNLVASLEVKW